MRPLAPLSLLDEKKARRRFLERMADAELEPVRSLEETSSNVADNAWRKGKGGRFTGSGKGGGGGEGGPKGSSGDSAGVAKRYGLVKQKAGQKATPDGQPIPPAWGKSTFVAKTKGDKLQAVGTDAKGRIQRVYSKKFAEGQAAKKFSKVKAMEKAQPKIQKRLQKDMKSKDPATRDAAAALSLIETTGIRPGGTGDTRGAKKAYGATTLQGKHVKVKGEKVTLVYTGKKGLARKVPVTNAALAKDLIARKKSAGAQGELFSTTDAQLRRYTSKATGGKYRPKDFRTLRGTQTARGIVSDMPRPRSKAAYKKAVKTVATKVSGQLGNTPAVALKSYIDPHVFSGWKQ